MASCILCFLFLEEVHYDYRYRVDMGCRISIGLGNMLRGRPWRGSESKGSYMSIDGGGIETELATFTEVEPCRHQDSGSRSLSRRLAFTTQMCLQILSATILGYLKIATLATLPVFLGTPHNDSAYTTYIPLKMTGGLGLNTQGTSNVLLAQATAAITFQLLAVPRIIEKLGPLRSYRLAISILICIYIVIPFSATLPSSIGIVAVIIDLWVYASVNGLATTCSAIL